ncbi:MAG TPA: hypothetical protein VKX31_03540, partial [Brumimicrobium sp.]|nr:hypothetical protein [Brumimicrobium sp.]
ETVKQSKLTYNPVIGIKIKSIGISKVFGKGRRNLNVDLELINVGNAPAIEVQIDSEIIYTHSEIKGEKSIPARFEPSMVSFLRTGDELKEDFKYSPSFGNACITHLFDDFRESHRLNVHRIETDPSRESYNASRIRVIVYYKNNVGQYFESVYESYLHLGADIETVFPKDNESGTLTELNVPRAKFHSGPIDKEKMEKEIANRNNKRDLCGW